ncbi:MAG: serine/threonine protein kinase [Myxococcales bacterium]|nr:serine/threonine protein kinase [Myxococcales bacterium]
MERADQDALAPTLRGTRSEDDARASGLETTAAPVSGSLPLATPRLGLAGEAMRARMQARLFGGQAPEVTVAGYTIRRRLGAGGMGVVYEAHDPRLDRDVAIKVLLPDTSDARAHARLEREARALAKLSHPNVVQVHEVGVSEGERGQTYIVMELVRGRPLSAWLDETSPTLRELLDAFIGAGRGLEAAHAAGIVHRDFKPDNVLMGDDGRARVVDFGIACQPEPDVTIETAVREDLSQEAAGTLLETMETQLADGPVGTRLTRTRAWVGTIAYMSPEQFEYKPVDARSDQFSFCVALHEALYGARPFPGKTVKQLVLSVVDGQVIDAPPGARVPAWLRAVVLRGLARDPARRYPDMGSLLAALADDPVRRRRRIAALSIGGVALAAASGRGGAGASPTRARAARRPRTRSRACWTRRGATRKSRAPSRPPGSRTRPTRSRSWARSSTSTRRAGPRRGRARARTGAAGSRPSARPSGASRASRSAGSRSRGRDRRFRAGRRARSSTPRARRSISWGRHERLSRGVCLNRRGNELPPALAGAVEEPRARLRERACCSSSAATARRSRAQRPGGGARARARARADARGGAAAAREALGTCW